MEISLQTPIKKKIIHKHVCTHIKNDVACTRTFHQASQMRAHIRFHHLGIFDFPCEKCNKKFEQKSNLKSHEQTVHSNEQKNVCNHITDGVACTRTFHQASQMRAHIRFHHLGIFDNVCEKCNNTFEQKSNLVAHEKTVHSKERPYSCEFIDKNQKQCEHASKTPKDLRQHMQTHMEKERYKCGKCDKSYGQLRHLQHHVDKVHEGISATFECTDCPNEYESYSGLWFHFLFKHADRSCPQIMAAIAKHRLSRNARDKKRRDTDPVYKLHCSLSSEFGNWMRRHGRSKSCRTTEILCSSYEAMVAYLNKNPQGLKYGDPGVDIDHIRPKSSFKKAGPVEQRELWCYWNLRLMTSYENQCVKRAYYDPIAYAESEIGQKIAELRPGWIALFGETEGPDIEHLDEDMELPDTADDDGYLSGVSEYTEDEDSDPEDECEDDCEDDCEDA
jgi:hypothetical protein